jgi:hypothetical protein
LIEGGVSMWEISGQGVAEFRANGWKLVVACDQPQVGGVRLLACREGLIGASARIAIPQYPLPPCDECYIRGDALHMVFPISPANPVGLELVMMAIEADQDLMIVESVLGLHTSLLDSHPKLELELGVGHPGFPVWGRAVWEKFNESPDWVWMRAGKSSPTDGPSVSASLLCDRRDLSSLSTSDQETKSSVQFFGDFLEKGVIRKVQPWWVWSYGPLPPRKANAIASYLAARPLALSN